MNGLAYEADYIVAWPTAEIAVMGPDGAVNIIHRQHARGDRGRRRARREAARAGRGDPRQHRSVHRGRPRPARRRDRPGRHARRDRARPADQRPTSGSTGRGASTASCRCEPGIPRSVPRRTTDVDGVLELWRRAECPSECDRHGARSRPRSIEAPQATVLVAVDRDGMIVGSIIATFDGWRGNVYRMAVDPKAYRRAASPAG